MNQFKTNQANSMQKCGKIELRNFNHTKYNSTRKPINTEEDSKDSQN